MSPPSVPPSSSDQVPVPDAGSAIAALVTAFGPVRFIDRRPAVPPGGNSTHGLGSRAA